MSTPNPEFLRFHERICLGGTETSIPELVRMFELESSGLILDQIESIKTALEGYEFEVKPPLNTGDLATTRIVRRKAQPLRDRDTLLREILQGEGPKQEFKATLLYDIKRAKAEPKASIQQLKSDDVLYSSLRTIGAYLNTGGGVLLVGVENDGRCAGLGRDFQIIKNGNGNCDSWELDFRNHIGSKFKDGTTINDYVTINFIEVDGQSVARIGIQQRRKVSFLREKAGSDKLIVFRRQGNRTVEVPVEEFEEFLLNRVRSGLHEEWNTKPDRISA